VTTPSSGTADIAALLGPLMQRYRDAGTAAETVYAALRDGIVNGMLPPGTRLRADELAKQLGISRTPIREAHLRLEAEGLIGVKPGVGLVVQAFSDEQIVEIYHIREALEGKAAALAAENATPYEREALRDLLEEIAETTQKRDFQLLRDLSGEFHLLVCRASHNHRLFAMLKDIQEHFRRFQPTTLTNAERADAALGELRAIVEGIDARDPLLAETAARRHRMRTLALKQQQGRRSRSAGIS
jgi:DNA-binding GntR family transcriptional regulator